MWGLSLIILLFVLMILTLDYKFGNRLYLNGWVWRRSLRLSLFTPSGSQPSSLSSRIYMNSLLTAKPIFSTLNILTIMKEKTV